MMFYFLSTGVDIKSLIVLRLPNILRGVKEAQYY